MLWSGKSLRTIGVPWSWITCRAQLLCMTPLCIVWLWQQIAIFTPGRQHFLEWNGEDKQKLLLQRVENLNEAVELGRIHGRFRSVDNALLLIPHTDLRLTEHKAHFSWAALRRLWRSWEGSASSPGPLRLSPPYPATQSPTGKGTSLFYGGAAIERSAERGSSAPRHGHRRVEERVLVFRMRSCAIEGANRCRNL